MIENAIRQPYVENTSSELNPSKNPIYELTFGVGHAASHDAHVQLPTP